MKALIPYFIGTIILISIIIIPQFLKSKKKKPISLECDQKPTIMIIIDSIMDESLKDVTNSGNAPALKYLLDQGTYYPEVVSSFPTMSVCIDTTLLTGVPPAQHHIYGLSFFSPEKNRVINLGTGMREIITTGPTHVLRDSVMNLNQHLINPETKTIHEELPKTGSINALIYKGTFPYQLKTPWLGRLLKLPAKVDTKAPLIFSFGKMKKLYKKTFKDTLFCRYGMNDHTTRLELISLMRENKLPPFTLAYFPKNDDHVHSNGTHTLRGLIKADKELQEILDAFSSWEDALKQCNFVILGDSGQTDMLPDHKQSYIYLRKIIPNYRIMPTKQRQPEIGDQIVFCVNERMAYIYILDDSLNLKKIAEELQEDRRLDVIAWQETDGINVISGNKPGKMIFREHGDKTDAYNQQWEINGDLSVLSLTIKDKLVKYGEYPDALFRLSNVMNTAQRVIVITCLPGYEMVDETSPTHTGGCHGSLHYMDSLVPMIVTGIESKPKHLRLIDLKEWLIKEVKK